MYHCKNCGTVLDDRARFCTKCGAKVERNQPVQNNYNQNVQGQQQLQKQMPSEQQLYNQMPAKQQLNSPMPAQNQVTQTNTGTKVNIVAIAIVAAIAVMIAGVAAFVLVVKPKMEQASDYKQAIAYASSGDYKQAADMFAYLGSYKDSEQKWAENKIKEAKQFIKAENDFDSNFSEAEEILETLEEKESLLAETEKKTLKKLQEQCRNYRIVKEYMYDGEYEEAKEILQKMDICQAVESKLEECNKSIQEETSNDLYGNSGENYDSIDDYYEDNDYEDDYYEENDYEDDYYEDDDYDDESDDYIIPYSASVLLSEADVEDLSWEEVALARNELYARHGYIFTKDRTKDYFEDKDWYVGTVSDQMKIYKEFSDIERKNVDFLADYEERTYGGKYSW